MKCQILFSGTSMKKNINCLSRVVKLNKIGQTVVIVFNSLICLIKLV